MIRIGMVGIGQIAEDYLSIFAKGEIKEAKIITGAINRRSCEARIFFNRPTPSTSTSDFDLESECCRVEICLF